MNSESQDIDGSQASISMACAEWPEGETDGHLLRPDSPEHCIRSGQRIEITFGSQARLSIQMGSFKVL